MVEDFSKMEPSPPPAFYDNLDGTLVEAWKLISHGAEDRRAEAHTPALATVGLDGAPEVRTVVLRAADPTRRTVAFHTDARSTKLEELRRIPTCSIMLYERSWKAQARLKGPVTIHRTNQVADAEWAQTPEMSRITYHVTTAPGAEIAAPTDAIFDASATSDGRDHFVYVVMEVREIEWLYLHHLGHRRARFSWTEDTWRKAWLAP